MFKGDLLKATQMIENKESNGGEDSFVPMISVDKFVDDRSKKNVKSDPFTRYNVLSY